MLIRLLSPKVPSGQSFFLWGARKTGKSTFIQSSYQNNAVFDLLDRTLCQRLSSNPALFREMIENLPEVKKNKPIVIDEVQKIPDLFDDIHWLIENKGYSFILTGSSARKLKHGRANMLGGRAWRYQMMPLCFPEIPNFQLLAALQRGLLPQHYLSENAEMFLEAYVTDYLAEEIQAEALVRNIPAFGKFLKALAKTHGNLTNYSSIASDCGVSSATVKEYYQVLIDTLIGYNIPPYSTKKSRQEIQKSPKFYLFDVGVANYICGAKILNLSGPQAGLAFEHYILMELLAFRAYKQKKWEISFWRTKSGLEIDFIVERNSDKVPLAIECKISSTIGTRDLKSLVAFLESEDCEAFVVCQEAFARTIVLKNDNETTQEKKIPPKERKILVLPWKQFLTQLWNEEFS
jgi:uncharacterized protein